jgi:putative ABC transport system permease protein
MAQSVRERTAELAVFKTLGFTSTAVTALVLAESVLLTGIGGLLGMGLAWIMVRAIEPAVSQYLPMWVMPPGTVMWALALMLGFGVVAGALPAMQAMRLRIVEALRRG